jgi:hypothetical protein
MKQIIVNGTLMRRASKTSSSRNGFAVVAWSIAQAMRLEGWTHGMTSQPSFETPRKQRGSSG